MGTDRPACIRMPQFDQRLQILLAWTQRGTIWHFFNLFPCYNSFSNSQESQCEGEQHTVIYTHKNTQTEQRDCLLLLCYCSRSVILWGFQVQTKKPNRLAVEWLSSSLCSAAACTQSLRRSQTHFVQGRALATPEHDPTQTPAPKRSKPPRRSGPCPFHLAP